MTAASRQLTAGRVGRAHGLDGSFYVEGPRHELAEGTAVTVAGRETVVERRAGTDQRPLVRLAGIDDRAAAEALLGEVLSIDDGGDLAEDEWAAADLIGCTIEGLGDVRRVIEAPSCDLLEVGPDAVLVPFVRDAVKRVDTESGVIEVDRAFLGLDE